MGMLIIIAFLLVQISFSNAFLSMGVPTRAKLSICKPLMAKRVRNSVRLTEEEIMEAMKGPSKKPEVKPAQLTSGGTKVHSIMNQGKPSERNDIINPNRLKIMGGTMKGRKIDSPDVYLRPMMAKVREALFSSLFSLELFKGENSRVLDIFAGSGSIGLEALSRGASHATFVDMSPECTSTALRNAAFCGFSSKVNACCANALDALREPEKCGLTGTYRLITLTPPYEEVSYPELIDAVCNSPLVAPDSVVVIEYPVEMKCLDYVLGGDKLFGVRNRRYGRTVLAMYVYRPTQEYDLRPAEFIVVEPQAAVRRRER